MSSEAENNVENQTFEEAPKAEWYILKVQVNREDTVKKTLDRRIKLAGLDDYFEQTLVPTETVVEMKNGKRREVKHKLYPGYLLAKMILNDETWFLVRETTGVGDFTGAGGKPLPMTQKDVDRLLCVKTEVDEKQPKLDIPYRIGDRVKINDGQFTNFKGEVSTIDELAGRITVIIKFLNDSPTSVDLEYWQVEKVEESETTR